MFVAFQRGSVDYQIGGSSTDLVLLFMNDHALQSLLSDKFKLSADASVAAGPVEGKAPAATDLQLNTEILSYSRSSGDKATYGPNVNRHDILDGKVRDPEPAHTLERELHRYAD